ncbi:MAG: transglycosylase domain-containing protein [Patescibacteria group bacterium]
MKRISSADLALARKRARKAAQQGAHYAHKIARHTVRHAHHWLKHRSTLLKEVVLVGISLCFIIGGFMTFWVSTFQLPDLASFEDRKLSESTKIYDRTGKILLYDVHNNIKRKNVAFEEISRNVKNATVAIEDTEFYEHSGIKPTAILRAIITDIFTLQLAQGGSTITQQVVKNSLLTTDKTITRKLKEWVLALKLERVLTKDQILGIYLNEAPYGGTIYGVEQASEEFFGVHASDLTLAQSAYLAALPQAPSFFSPFGNHVDRLEVRKNVVLQQMLEHAFITQKEYDAARKETVTFNKPENRGIKAPHFVFYIREYITEKYGEQVVSEGGLKVITTLDYELQQKGEEIVKRFAIDNKKTIDAENAALVALDPKTGQILTMIGSRDYFDTEINGNFNVTLARRQPGSSFKPFVYAEAFIKGYSPETVLFDLPTEFSSDCTPNITVSATSTQLIVASSTPNRPDAVCYSPRNYDGGFRGPITLRDALAQSINIPAIKTLYLAGIHDSLTLAKEMGISGLADADRYGLTLVLGGGEVTPLDMTSAYSVFANQGVRNPETGILKITDRDGNVLEQFQARPVPVLDPNIALTISDVLSDNEARAPIFGNNSALRFPGYDVAVKTGTTNEFKDMWVVGYTPNIAVGAWAGNNDGRPIAKENSARQVIAPLWNAFMYETFKKYPAENFPKPTPLQDETVKPVLRGFWQGNQSYSVDKITGKLATEYTPPELREERVIRSAHSILYWIDKNDPNGPQPLMPSSDPSFANWEYSVQKWAELNRLIDEGTGVIPTQKDDVHVPEFFPSLTFTTPAPNASLSKTDTVSVSVGIRSHFPLNRIDYYLNNAYLGTTEQSPWIFSFHLSDTDSANLSGPNVLKAVAKDSVGNKTEATTSFNVL